MSDRSSRKLIAENWYDRSESDASVRIVHDLYLAMVGLDDLLHYWKPESCPFFFCGKKGRKHFLSSIVRNTTAMVRHIDNEFSSLTVRMNRHGFSFRRCLDGVH